MPHLVYLFFTVFYVFVYFHFGLSFYAFLLRDFMECTLLLFYGVHQPEFAEWTAI